MAQPPIDWVGVAGRISRGDRLAFLKLCRLITGFLAQWRAFDFFDDWDDIVQDTAAAFVDACEKNRIQDAAAARAYIRQTTRHKFFDRIRQRKRRREDDLPVEAADLAERTVNSDEMIDLDREIRRLSDRERRVVVATKVEGKTLSEFCAESGESLGTARRDLAAALRKLRRWLGS